MSGGNNESVRLVNLGGRFVDGMEECRPTGETGGRVAPLEEFQREVMALVCSLGAHSYFPLFRR